MPQKTAPLRAGLAATTLGVALALTACAPETGRPDVFTTDPHRSAYFPNINYATWSEAEPAYRFYPGDELDLSVPSAPELNKTVTVQPDGRISVPLLPPVMVADRTIEDVERVLTRDYSSQLLRPDVSIAVRAQTLKVFVGGEVQKPGIYDMPGDINALQAVILAGGFTPIAKRTQVVILRRGRDGQPMMRTANLMRAVSDPDLTDAVPLRRFDVVYVPRTRVGEVGLFVQQYLRDASPINLGFSYAAGSNAYVAATVAP